MKNSRTAFFLVAGILLSLVFLAGCVSSPHQNSLETANSSGALQNSSAILAPELVDTNLSLRKIPPKIQHEIQLVTDPLAIDKWEFDLVKRDQINVYVYDIRNESEIVGYQGKRIGNYTLHIIHDTEFETTRSEVSTYLMQLRKNPDYQIAHVSMITNSFEDPIGYYAELGCYGSTPQNKKLGGVVIKGWTILVYPMSPPPTPQRTITNSSNTFS
jgi:hypothetical protein